MTTEPNMTDVQKEIYRQEGYELAKKHFQHVEDEAYDRGAMEATTVCNEMVQKARLEAIEEVMKLPRRSLVAVETAKDTITKSYTVALSDVEALRNK